MGNYIYLTAGAPEYFEAAFDPSSGRRKSIFFLEARKWTVSLRKNVSRIKSSKGN